MDLETDNRISQSPEGLCAEEHPYIDNLGRYAATPYTRYPLILEYDRCSPYCMVTALGRNFCGELRGL